MLRRPFTVGHELVVFFNCFGPHEKNGEQSTSDTGQARARTIMETLTSCVGSRAANMSMHANPAIIIVRASNPKLGDLPK